MRKSILFAAAFIAAVSCSPKETVLSAKFGETVPEEVRVVCGDIDTTVAVTNGSFALTLPVNTLTMASVRAGGETVYFIPDGGDIVIDVTGAEAAVIASGKNSLNERLRAIVAYRHKIIENYKINIEPLMNAGDKDALEALSYRTLDTLAAYYKEVITLNKDNILSVYALEHIINDGSPAAFKESKECIGLLSDAVKELPRTQDLVKDIEASENTAEGKMFSDFEIVTDSETGKTAKLSDYVGKGKYVLVDFWASWCVPCKREIPYLKKAYNRFKGDNFDMLSVAVWDRSPQASLDTAAAYGVNWHHIINAQSIPTDIYAIKGIPHIILFGPDGTILKRDLREEAIEEEIAKYVK